MNGSPVRQWEFWRGRFWRRPILMAVLGLVLFAASVICFREVATAYSVGQALDDGRLCAPVGAAVEDCLESVAGRLDGPRSRARGPDTEWWLHTDSGRLLDFEAGLGSGLEDGDRAVALVHGTDRVAAVVVGDRTVRAQDAGAEGIVLYGSIGIAALAGGALALEYAWSTWRRTGSLITVNGNGWSGGDPTPRVRLIAVIALVAFGCTFAAVLLGAPWWLGLASPFLVGGALTLVGRAYASRRDQRVRGSHRRTGRHAGKLFP